MGPSDGEGSENDGWIDLTLTISPPLTGASRYAARITTKNESFEVVDGKSTQVIAGLCHATLTKARSPHPRGRSGTWNFGLLWLLARGAGIGFNDLPRTRVRETAVPANELQHLPIAMTSGDGMTAGTIDQNLRVYRVGPGSDYVEVDKARTSLRLRSKIRVALQVPNDLVDVADELVLGKELAALLAGQHRQPLGTTVGVPSEPQSVALNVLPALQVRQEVTEIVGREWAMARRPEIHIVREPSAPYGSASIVQALEKPQVLEIHGGAGLGKSTQLAEAFERWVEEYGAGAFLQLEVHADLWASDPEARLNELLGRPWGRWIETARSRGHRPAVFFDTLDVALSQDSAPRLVRLVEQLVQAGIGVALTCREADLHVWASAAAPTRIKTSRVQVAPFRVPEIERYTRRYAVANEGSQGVDGFVGDVLRLAERPGFGHLLAEPLFLWMTCRVYRSRGEVPEHLTLAKLFGDIYTFKVVRPRHVAGRSDGPHQREGACGHASRAMLANSTRALNVWAGPLAPWVTSPGIPDALATLESESIFERHEILGYKYFHQVFTEYMLGRLLASEPSLHDDYLRRFAASPTTNQWLAPVFRFSLTMCDPSVVEAAIALLPENDEGAFRAIVLAMAQAAPGLLEGRVRAASTMGQRLALVEALAQVNPEPGSNIPRLLLSLVHPEDSDFASTAAVLAMVPYVMADVAPGRSALEVVRALIAGNASAGHLLGRFVSALEDEPQGEKALAGLAPVLSAFGRTGRHGIARAVADHGSHEDVVTALRELKSQKIEGDLRPFADLAGRGFLLYQGYEGLPFIGAVARAFEETRRYHKAWRPIIARAGAEAILRNDMPDVAAMMVAAISQRTRGSDVLQIVLRALGESGAHDLVIAGVRTHPSWWESPGAGSLADLVAELVQAGHLSDSDLSEGERAAVAGKLDRPEPRPVRASAELHGLIDDRDDVVAHVAMGDLARIAKGADGDGALALLAPGLTSRHLRVRVHALNEMTKVRGLRQVSEGARGALLRRLQELACSTADPGEFNLALVLWQQLDGARPTNTWTGVQDGFLVQIGQQVLGVPALRTNGGAVKAWCQLWGVATDPRRSGRADDERWAIYSVGFRALDVSVGQDALNIAPTALRQFFSASPPRAMELADNDKLLPEANITALLRATVVLDATAKAELLNRLAQDARATVRAAVARFRME